MPTPLRVLILEDQPTDAELILHELRRAGFEPDWRRVETEGDFLAVLNPALDLILADYSLPQFDGLSALRLLRARGLDLPFILVSGTIGEDIAVSAMKEGADDYLLKDRLTRLGPAVRNALEQKRLRDERKQAEGRLRLQGAALEAAANSMFITDRDGEILWVNLAFTAMAGYTAEESIGHNPRFLKSGKQDQAYYRNLWDTILAGQVWRGEVVNRRKDGSLYTGEATITPVRDERGAIAHYVAVEQDITERKRAEADLAAKNEELRAMTQQLWQTAKLATMGELAASIAHELNNPLATVSLRVEGLLGQVPAHDPSHRALEVIGQEVERMGALVANLLQFSRRGSQQVSTLDVREEIAKTLELIHYQLRQRQIVVAQEFAPGVPLIQADRQQLRQLFLNLFANASDAMLQGGTLTIRVSAALDGKQVVTEIADTGVGIAAEDLPKVTEPFFTTKPEGKGTGLGLAICRRIAQEHGGTLDLTSAGPGQGTTVHIALLVKNRSNGTALRRD